MSDQVQVERAFGEIEEAWGGIDGLFNAAAVPANNVFDTDPAVWEKIVGINLIGYMRCAREAVLLMRKGGTGGRIVNIGSLCVKVIDNGCDIYMATKAGVAGFVDSLRKEVAPDGIQVTLIHPGQIASEMASEGPEEKAAMVDRGDSLTPEDVADAARYCFALPKRVAVTHLELRPVGQGGL